MIHRQLDTSLYAFSEVLQENLVRKYLHYDVDTRKTIGAAEFTNCVNRDIFTLVDNGSPTPCDRR